MIEWFKLSLVALPKHSSLKLLTKGSFVKMGSYSVNSSLYANTVLRQESISGLAENAAEEIRNRLMMFFVKG